MFNLLTLLDKKVAHILWHSGRQQQFRLAPYQTAQPHDGRLDVDVDSQQFSSIRIAQHHKVKEPATN